MGLNTRHFLPKRRITPRKIIITNFRTNFVCSTHCLKKKKLCLDIRRNEFTLYRIWIVEILVLLLRSNCNVMTRNIRFFNVCVPFTTTSRYSYMSKFKNLMDFIPWHFIIFELQFKYVDFILHVRLYELRLLKLFIIILIISFNFSIH